MLKKRTSRTRDTDAKRRKIWAFISRKEIPRVCYLNYHCFPTAVSYVNKVLFCRPKGKRQQLATPAYRMLKRLDKLHCVDNNVCNEKGVSLKESVGI